MVSECRAAAWPLTPLFLLFRAIRVAVGLAVDVVAVVAGAEHVAALKNGNVQLWLRLPDPFFFPAFTLSPFPFGNRGWPRRRAWSCPHCGSPSSSCERYGPFPEFPSG